MEEGKALHIAMEIYIVKMAVQFNCKASKEYSPTESLVDPEVESCQDLWSKP